MRNKAQAKIYNGKKKKLLNATGNPVEQIPDNEIYNKIIRVIGESHKQGLEIIPEIGCKNPVSFDPQFNLIKTRRNKFSKGKYSQNGNSYNHCW